MFVLFLIFTLNNENVMMKYENENQTLNPKGAFLLRGFRKTKAPNQPQSH